MAPEGGDGTVTSRRPGPQLSAALRPAGDHRAPDAAGSRYRAHEARRPSGRHGRLPSTLSGRHSRLPSEPAGAECAFSGFISLEISVSGKEAEIYTIGFLK